MRSRCACVSRGSTTGPSTTLHATLGCAQEYRAWAGSTLNPPALQWELSANKPHYRLTASTAAREWGVLWDSVCCFSETGQALQANSVLHFMLSGKDVSLPRGDIQIL